MNHPAGRSPTPTVIVIDDEPALRELLATSLARRGWRVLQAASGVQGLELCQHEQPDVVLCDLRMPGLNGLDVLAALSRDAPELPVILVSGVGGLDDVITALKRGAWDYLTKPIEDMTVLYHAVERAIERAHLLRENRLYRDYLEASNRQLQESLRKLQDDEEAGRHLQFQLLPPTPQTLHGYQFSHQVLTSLYLSGDFVDYFSMDERYIGFYLADVAGHGVSSAFVTVLLRSIIHRYVDLYRQGQEPTILQPAPLLARLNQELLKAHLNKYLTLFYGVIDSMQGTLTYSNGGQFPFPLFHQVGQADYLETKSLPVGLFDFADYPTVTMALPPAFELLLLSDGILDVLSQSNLQQKLDFIRASVVQHTPLQLPVLIQQLGLGRANLPDDVTLLLITRQV